jgi:hypothetical protein
MTKWKYNIEIEVDDEEISQLVSDEVIEEGCEDNLIVEHLTQLDFVKSAYVVSALVV